MMSGDKLPGHVRATFTFYLMGPYGVEIAAAVKNMTHVATFAEDASGPEFMRAMGMNPDLAEDFRFMTAEETADYLARQDNDDSTDDEVEAA